MNNRKIVIAAGIVLFAALFLLVVRVNTLSRKVRSLENTIAVLYGDTKAPPAEAEAPKSSGKKGPMVAIVLDDLGYSKRNLGQIRDLGAPVTLAILPSAPYSKAVDEFARKNGFETLIHLPLEPKNQASGLEKDTIMTSMSDRQVKDIINNARRTVSSASGMNNHMGSKATADERIMDIVLSDVKKRGQFFLDSYTAGDSVCEHLALIKGVPYLRRSVFLDNKNDESYVSGQMEKVRELAVAKGRVVAIGHDRPVTVKVLKKYMPMMEKDGIRFVTLAELVKAKEK